MKYDNLHATIGEIVTTPGAQVELQIVTNYKERILGIIGKTKITLKKVIPLSDAAKDMINEVNLPENVKIALIMAFTRDLIQACLDRNKDNVVKYQRKRDKDPEVDAADIDVNDLTYYKNKITDILTTYVGKEENAAFRIGNINTPKELPKELKKTLRYDIFRSANEMDDKKKVFAAREALQQFMPRASKPMIASFYAHVSAKFRNKRKH